MEKSKRCPEYDGKNSVHIALVFANHLQHGETVKTLHMCRDNNLQYWSERRFRELYMALDAEYRKKLLDFCATYRNWFGEVPIYRPKKHLSKGGRGVVTLTTYSKDGVATRVQAISSVRTTATSDDQRNGAWYLDHQLDRILRESSLK